MDRQTVRKWAFQGEHVKVYPVPTKDFYNAKTSAGKKIKLPYVKIEIEIGNAKHLGKEVYKQNTQELTEKIDEIYLYYYKKATK